MQDGEKKIVVYTDREKLIQERPRSVLLRISLFYNLFFANPILVIDNETISYNPPKIGPFAFQGAIRWEEIEALYLGELTTRRRGKIKVLRFLCILPRDVERFMQSFSLINKTVLGILMIQVGTPFAISESLLTGTVDQLLARIQIDYLDKLKEYHIEIREEYKGSITASK